MPRLYYRDPADGVLKPLDGVLYGMDQVSSDARYVKKSGDLMTGDLATEGLFALRKNGVTRWNFYKYGNETGSNAGSDLVIGAYDDSGAYINSHVFIYRASGAVSIPGLLPTSNGQVSLNAGWTIDAAQSVVKAAGVVSLNLGIKRNATGALPAGLSAVGSIPAAYWPAGGTYGVAAATLTIQGIWYPAMLVVGPDGSVSVSQGQGAKTLAVNDYLYGCVSYRSVF